MLALPSTSAAVNLCHTSPAASSPRQGGPVMEPGGSVAPCALRPRGLLCRLRRRRLRSGVYRLIDLLAPDSDASSAVCNSTNVLSPSQHAKGVRCAAHGKESASPAP
eukprot:scaffold4659_cov352-Prasinococcus_capsulatus_cf.AAC.5